MLNIAMQGSKSNISEATLRVLLIINLIMGVPI